MWELLLNLKLDLSFVELQETFTLCKCSTEPEGIYLVLLVCVRSALQMIYHCVNRRAATGVNRKRPIQIPASIAATECLGVSGRLYVSQP
jgi:hypothetical protein